MIKVVKEKRQLFLFGYGELLSHTSVSTGNALYISGGGTFIHIYDFFTENTLFPCFSL